MDASPRNQETVGDLVLWKLRFMHSNIFRKILPFQSLQPRKERAGQEGESSLQQKRWKDMSVKDHLNRMTGKKQTLAFQSTEATLAGNIETIMQLRKKPNYF